MILSFLINLESLLPMLTPAESNVPRILSVLLGLLLLWPILHNLASENDFDLFILAAEKWKLQLPVYQDAIIHGRYFYYSPLFLTLLQPFLWFHDIITSDTSIFQGYALSYILAKATWSVINGWIIVFFIRELLNRFQFQSKSVRNAFLILLFYFGYRWLFLNLWHSQLTLFVLWAVYYSTLRKSECLLSQWWTFILATNFKILPSFWCTKMAYERNWEDILLIAAAFILMMFVPILFSPYNYVIQETIEWLQRINPLKAQHVLTVGEGGFVDLGSLAVKYLTQIRINNEPNVSIAHFNASGVFVITQLARLGVLGMIFYMYRFIKKWSLYQSDFLIFSIFCMGVPLIFPHQRDYSLAMLLPSLCYLIYQFVNPNYHLNSIISGLFLVSLFLMGNAIFFEMFSYDFRVWIIGVRLQGLGALLYFVCYILFVFDLGGKETHVE